MSIGKLAGIWRRANEIMGRAKQDALAEAGQKLHEAVATEMLCKYGDRVNAGERDRTGIVAAMTYDVAEKAVVGVRLGALPPAVVDDFIELEFDLSDSGGILAPVAARLSEHLAREMAKRCSDAISRIESDQGGRT